MDSVSVIICCHNSSIRIPRVLRHLQNQDVPSSLAWEIVLVDNASDDETVTVARHTWGIRPRAELRIVREPRMGVAHARAAGLRNARYTVASFVDDDNLVAPNWVATVSSLMSARPDTAVIGSYNIPYLLRSPVSWFDGFSASFGIGAQGDGSEDVTEERGYVWGAGLSLRRSAWARLVEHGFEPINLGRSGKGLSAGDDAELCLALRLAGWRIRYEPSLTLKHEIPPIRLQWEYLLRLHRGLGQSSVGLDPYLRAANPTRRKVGDHWLPQAFLAAVKYLKQGIHVIPAYRKQREGSAEALRAEWLLGRLQELTRVKSDFERRIRQVARATWVKL